MNDKCCIICGQQYKSINKLIDHVTVQHDLSARLYFIKKDHNGNEPLCMCGCLQPTTYFENTRTFGRYLRGHISRVKNNWGHNADVLAKSHETMRIERALGLHPSWCKGLTKETDSRVAALAQANSKTIKNDPERIRVRSERMKRNRLNGTIPTLYGSESSRWKGGTASLNGECHGDSRLYHEWKFPKFKEIGFKCAKCSSTVNLCVHHDKERMADIIQCFVKKHDYDATIIDYEKKKAVIHDVVMYHIENNVSGVVLCFECHKIEHNNVLNYRHK